MNHTTPRLRMTGKLQILLMSLLMMSAATYTMDNENNTTDPMIIENKMKLVLSLHKIVMNIAPQLLLANFVKGVGFIQTDHEIEGIQILLKNSNTITVFKEDIPDDLKNEFKLAHQELAKLLPQSQQD